MLRLSPPRTGVVMIVVAMLSGCATSFIPSPEEVPRLEERVEERPDDVEALTRLGAAYQEADRLSEAADLLERARESDPEDANAAFFLGLVYEELDRPGEAIAALEDYLALSPDSHFQGAAEGRIRVLRRAELRQVVRANLEREAELAATPAEGTVAVFPFVFAGADENLRPLGRALAEMLVTDLSVTGRLDVLERVRIQALLDEVALTETGLADPETGARSGRLLGAGRVVQGQISGPSSSLALDAAVVTVRPGAEPATVSQRDDVDRLFDMEKALALDVYEAMGVSLTAAERELVNERQTENLQALLAFGLGLEASDAGRYEEAQARFAEAARIDPGFEQAEQLAVETAEVAAAEVTTPEAIAAEVATAGVSADIATQVAVVTEEATQAGTRDATQEALGTEGVSSSPTQTLIQIILRRPGGGQ